MNPEYPKVYQSMQVLSFYVHQMKSLSKINLIFKGSFTVTAYFEDSLTIGIMSTSCTPDCLILSDLTIKSELLTCPDITNIGIDSIHAPTKGVIIFVEPGPVVTKATLTLLVNLE